MTLPNLSINGNWNHATRVALQRHMTTKNCYSGYIDGSFGTLSKKGLQRLMKSYGWYTGYIDGDFGSMSRYALHRFLQTTWGCWNYLSWADQAQVYYAPWSGVVIGQTNHVADVVKAVQSGLNRHGHYYQLA